MYSLVKAYGKESIAGSRWKEVDISTISLATLYSKYSEVKAILSNTDITNNVTFDLELIKSVYQHSSSTFIQYLSSIGSSSLNTSNVIFNLKESIVKYADIFHAGYKVIPVHPTASADSDIPESEKTYLKLTKDLVDYQEFYKNCLVSVNGYLHITDYDKTGIYVVDGNTTRRTAKTAVSGVYSFKDVGNINLIPITESMVLNQLPEIPLKNKVYIKLNEKINNRFVILSIGGYLHVLDSNIYSVVDDYTILIKFSNIPFIERYYESVNTIDLSTLNLDKYSRNDTQVELAQLYSDDVIRAYLSISQSFVILLDSTDLFVEKVSLEKAPSLNTLITNTKPNLPAIGGHGKLMEYWYAVEAGQYSLKVISDRVDNNLAFTTDVNNLISVTDHRVPTQESFRSNSYFLRIGKDTVI